MGPSRRQARLHALSLVLIWGAWMATGTLVLGQIRSWETEAAPLQPQRMLTASWTILLLLAAWAALHTVLPALAAAARVGPYRLLAAFALAGVGGGLFGARIALAPLGPLPRVDESQLDGLLALRLVIGILGLTLLLLVRMPASSPGPLFLLSSHSSDRAARRAWLSLFAQWGLLVFSWLTAAQRQVEIEFGLAVLVGILLAAGQRFSQRAIGFVPPAWLGAATAWLAAGWRPEALSPWAALGVCLGLSHVAARAEIVIRVHPSRRWLAAVLISLAAAVGGLVGAGLHRALADRSSLPIIGAIIALGLASLAVYGFFRELLELLVEPILGIMYRIRATGPGVHRVPTRGPTVIIANHAAWFDPLWVAKVMPLRVRPMMTARFYDLPCISWLMRRVFFTIRVPEAQFRRETPEIDIAVQAIDQGDNLLIFPEGWLKRREEQSLRRFGHGIHEILRRRPQTPVIACWIEGGWGSYVSYKGGPPTVNKKLDLFRSIRIGISEPEYLPEDMLRDHWRTRRYLMTAVLRARTHLGLPELPLALPETNDHDGDTPPTEDGSSASAGRGNE